MNPNIVASLNQISVGTALLAGITAYSTYIVTSWLYYFAITPSTNHRLVAAQKKGKVANVTDIPGPTGLPFLGPLFDMLPYLKRMRMEEFFCDLNIKCNGISKIKTDKYMISVDDTVMVKKIANNPDTFPRGSHITEIMFDSVPTALFALPSGEQWKMHRKGLQPAFGPSHLRDAFTFSLEITDQLLDIWEKDGCRNVNEDLSMLTGEVIAKIAFSIDLGAIKSLTSNNHVEFFKHTENIVSIAQTRFGFITRKYLWPLIGVGEKHARPSIDFIMTFLNKVIEERKLKHAKSRDNDLKSKDWSLDLLDRLLAPKSNFTEEEIKSEVLGFFIAGHETTAHTLTWVLYELSKHPHIYEKLTSEVEQILGSEKPTLDNLASLKYLDAVLKESMRVHAVVPFFVRETAAYCELAGSDGLTIALPPGAQLITNISRIHLHEKYWGEDAALFNPDRWDNGFVPIPGSYLPFGDGPTNCIGQKMALIEAKVVLLRTIQRFKKISISPKQGPIEPVTSLTHGLKHGLLVDFVKR